MVTSKKSKDGISILFAFFFCCAILSVFLAPQAWSQQCTSCDNCLPPAINYQVFQQRSTGKTLQTNESINLSATGGYGTLSWSLNGGSEKGTFVQNPPQGETISYRAPLTNANCSNNPVITVTDTCGRSASVGLAVNAKLGFSAGYTTLEARQRPGGEWSQCSCAIYSVWTLCSGYRSDIYWYCSSCPPTGAFCPSGGLLCHWGEDAYPVLDECCEIARGNCSATEKCPDGCSPGWHDLRDVAGGCCIHDVIPCDLSINSYQSDKSTINLRGGEKAIITAVISVESYASINWTLDIAGNTFTGTGSSVSASWDGKYTDKKAVAPGNYMAHLDVQTSGGRCVSNNYSGDLQIVVMDEAPAYTGSESTHQPETCPVEGSVTRKEK